VYIVFSIIAGFVAAYLPDIMGTSAKKGDLMQFIKEKSDKIDTYLERDEQRELKR
jgi:uncharacterized membrane-anchored protein YitT (DUF2179 family)